VLFELLTFVEFTLYKDMGLNVDCLVKL